MINSDVIVERIVPVQDDFPFVSFFFKVSNEGDEKGVIKCIRPEILLCMIEEYEERNPVTDAKTGKVYPSFGK